MKDNITFAIDLGTTNSLISKYVNGTVKVFKNPSGLKETLPSVVAFKNERILVGDKAKEYVMRDPSNTFSSFKRKMGTTERFFAPAINKEVSPVDLSSIVLKELKSFSDETESLKNIVITIPASFDTIQSNATKQAAELAGFENIFLLQEPIAASLAYMNNNGTEKKKNGKWIVYDLGGGTFDVALLQVKEEELKVVDHKGNNYLGGVDFDIAIVEKIIVPKILSFGNFEGLQNKLKSKEKKYSKLFFKLLKIAEEVKIDLSSKENVEVDFEINDFDNEPIDCVFLIQKKEFEETIKKSIQETIDLTLDILNQNEVQIHDIEEIMLVGGSTYLPLVRQMLKNQFAIPINTSIDPTNSVATGAAYYASNVKVKALPSEATASKQVSNIESGIFGLFKKESVLTFDSSYPKNSKSESEYFAFKVSGTLQGNTYRIIRKDGGFDSGVKKLKEMNGDHLNLLKDSMNYFELKVYNKKQENIYSEQFEIAQGNYSVYGQPLPEDICLEVDDLENDSTKLELVFKKNSILPLSKTVTKTLSHQMMAGTDDKIKINVLEGSYSSVPSSCKSIGYIEINLKDLKRNLAKRADIEISIKISESRDVEIEAYISMVDYEKNKIFNGQERLVDASKLISDINELRNKVEVELVKAERMEAFELASSLVLLQYKVEEAYHESISLTNDDVTDLKFKLEDKKREYANQLYQLTKNTDLVYEQSLLIEERNETVQYIEQKGNQLHKQELNLLLDIEKRVMSSTKKSRIIDLKNKYKELREKVFEDSPEYYKQVFYNLKTWYNYESNQSKADNVIKKGDKLIRENKLGELRFLCNSLIQLLPKHYFDKVQSEIETKKGKLGIN